MNGRVGVSKNMSKLWKGHAPCGGGQSGPKQIWYRAGFATKCHAVKYLVKSVEMWSSTHSSKSLDAYIAQAPELLVMLRKDSASTYNALMEAYVHVYDAK